MERNGVASRAPLLVCLGATLLLTSASPNVQSSSARGTTFTYDAAGNLETRTTAGGGTARYSYDLMNRPVGIVYPDGSQVRFEYDRVGRRVRMTDSGGATSYTYDIHDRLVAVTDPNGNTLRYEWDARGLPTRLVYPDGSDVRYSWDADAHLTSIVEPSGTTQYRYDADGRPVFRVLPNGVTTRFTWGVAGHIQTIHHAAADGSPLLRFEYDVDAAGNWTRVTRSERGEAGRVTQYNYDPAHRLKGVTYADGEAVTYDYDLAGNRTAVHSSTRGTTTFTYLDGDLTQIDGPEGRETFRYDADGNVAERVRTTGRVVRYFWDSERRLRRVEAAGETIEFMYDGDGRLLRRTAGGRTRFYINDATDPTSRILAEGWTGSPLTRFPLGLEPLGETGGPSDRFYLTDASANVVALVDKSGRLLRTFEYDPFGASRDAASPSGPVMVAPAAALSVAGAAGGVDAPRFGAAGLRADPDIGLLDNRYAPDVARNLDRFQDLLGSVSTATNIVSDEAALFGAIASFYTNPATMSRWKPHPRLHRFLADHRQGIQTVKGAADWALLGLSGIEAGARAATTLNEGYGTGFAALEVASPLMAKAAAERFAAAYERRKHQTLFGKAIFPTASRSLTTTVRLAARSSVYGFLVGTAVDQSLKAATLSAQVVAAGYQRDKLIRETVRSLHGRGLGEYALRDYLRREGITIENQDRFLAGVSRADAGGTGSCAGPHCDCTGPSCLGSAVGGVSLDVVGKLLGDMGDITSATYDPRAGQIVLIGRDTLAATPLDPADLAVAIRTIQGGEEPSMSIEPCRPGADDGCMKVLYNGRFQHPDLPGEGWVTYTSSGKLTRTAAPATFGTHFGWVIYEADRYLKTATLGRSNVDESIPFESRVPGFVSELDRMAAAAGSRSLPRDRCEIRTEADRNRSSSCHRMWFVPNDVVLRTSPDGLSLTFDPVSIRTEARFVRFDASGQMVDVPGDDSAVAAFVDHFNANFAAFAAEKRELAELTTLARIVGLVRWLRDKNIPLDSRWVTHTRLGDPVETPLTTPGITTASGSVRLYGGVEFPAVNRYIADASAAQPGTSARNERPSFAAFAWNVSAGPAQRRAVAFNPAPTRIVGGYTTVADDATVPAAGGRPLRFRRRYSSTDPSDHGFGPGWSMDVPELTIERERTADGRDRTYAVVRDGDLTTRLSFTTEGVFRPRPDDHAAPYEALGIKSPSADRAMLVPEVGFAPGPPIQVFDESGSSQAYAGFALHRRDGSTMVFNEHGQLTREIAPDGKAVAYDYTDRELTRVADTEGNWIRLVREGDGRVHAVETSIGERRVFEYDAAGNLERVADGAGARLADYSYDGARRLSRVVNRDGRGIVQQEYDDLGRVLRSRTDAGHAVRFEYDDRSGTVTQQSEIGAQSSWSHDAAGRLVARTDGTGASTTFQWNDRDQLTATTDARGNTTSLEYTEQGLLAGVASADGGRTRILGYNQAGRPEVIADPASRMSLTEYDGRGRVTKIQTGLTLESVSADGRMTYSPVEPLEDSFAYDAANRLLAVSDGEGNVTRFAYDGRGNVTQVTSPGGTAVRQRFDAESRLASIAEPSGAMIGFEYNDDDNLVVVATPGGRTRFEYEGERLMAVVDPAGSRLRLGYDSVGRVTTVTDANDAVTTAEYDSRGNLIALIDPLGERSSFTFDGVGRMTAEYRGAAPVASAVGPAAPSILGPAIIGLLVLAGGTAVVVRLARASSARRPAAASGRRSQGRSNRRPRW